MTTETIVLAGLLNNGKNAWTDNQSKLSVDLFTGEHRAVYKAIEGLHTENRVVDPVTVVERLGDQYMQTVTEIAMEYTALATLPMYVNELIVRVNESRAESIGLQLASDRDIESAQLALASLTSSSSELETVSSLQSAQIMLKDLMDKRECENTGLETGLYELDKYLGGLTPGQFVVFAARPSMGKTALLLNVCYAAKCRVGIFSLEMTSAELTSRLVAAIGSVDMGRLKHPKNLRDDDWKKITSAVNKLEDKLLINDTGGISISSIEAESRRMVKNGAGMICIDYLQLVTCRADNRLEEVSEVSRRIKSMAKNLGVPVLVMAQLNRKVEDTFNPVYSLSMLRESGQIEQDADIVVFIDRPEQRTQDKERPGEADLIVAKNRNGECGTARVCWQGQYQRFVNREYFNERTAA